MSDPTGLAESILDDLRAGLEDSEIVVKYQLSSEGLQDLFDDLVTAGLLHRVGERYVLPAVRRIDAQDFVTDVRGGMTGYQLMEKYELSSKGFQSTLRNLVATAALDLKGMPEELSLRHDAELPENIRGIERYHLDFDLPILETNRPENTGKVRDISQNGLGVVDLLATAGEMKHLRIFHEKFVLIKPFEFEAECRWSRNASGSAPFAAGFKITGISDGDSQEMRKLIRLVTIYG
ncbi:MAG: PilZ domain-containing protein [Desulfomonile tiedjei]|nr:PilZ domain-containing protein [Desulfomonile tiedjei]